MAITAGLIKELREKTGAGMMDCKVALTENAGNMEAAIDWLRAKGLAKAAKKAGRVAAEGLIGIATDFVARNDQFQNMVRSIAQAAVGTNGAIEDVAAATFPGSEKSIDDYIKEMIGTIGENMNLRRSAVSSVEKGVVATYMHNWRAGCSGIDRRYDQTGRNRAAGGHAYRGDFASVAQQGSA